MAVFGGRHRRKYRIPEIEVTPYNSDVVEAELENVRRTATSNGDVSAVDPDEPPLDPGATDRAYWYHRARRHARIEHRRAMRRAGARFWLVLLVLVAVTVAIAVFVAHDVQRLFGV